MKAALLLGPRDLRVQSSPVPELSAGEVLVRVDVEFIDSENLASYVQMLDSGEVLESVVTLGPDLDGLGVPSMAVIHLLREMVFFYEDGPIELVQASRVFDREMMRIALECSHAARSITSLATSARVQ